jgi:hypothetical protein
MHNKASWATATNRHLWATLPPALHPSLTVTPACAAFAAALLQRSLCIEDILIAMFAVCIAVADMLWQQSSGLRQLPEG